MTVRQRVIAGLGGKCVWCNATEHLEIDHVKGGGKLHRKTIRVKFETWLEREYKRTGYWWPYAQLLCKRCHAYKSGRLQTVAAKNGYVQTNVQLPEELASQLTTAASQKAMTKNSVVEQALRIHLEGNEVQTITNHYHDRISIMHADIKNILETLKELLALQHRLESRFLMLEQDHDKQYAALIDAFDRFRRKYDAPRKRWPFLWRN